MDIYAQIAKTIKEMCGTSKGAAIFPAKVKSIDGNTCTITVGTLELTDVRLRAVVNSESEKIIVTPKDGSQVLVADFSGGNYRDLVVISYSEAKQIDCVIGQTTVLIDKDGVVINGGNLYGIVKIQQLTDKLNALVDWCKNHTHSGVITAVTGGSGAPAVGTLGNSAVPTSVPDVFNKDDYEDDKVKH